MFIVLSIEQWHAGKFLSYPQIPYHSYVLPSVYVTRAPHALVAKTISNQSHKVWRQHFWRSYILASSLRTDDERVGARG